MLGKRITAEREYISLHDPAFLQADAKQKALYVRTRNIEDLGDWKQWHEAPTVFTVRPLVAGYGHLADRFNFLDRRTLFQLHVSNVADFQDGGPPLKWDKQGDELSLSDGDLARFGDEVVDEIATFIVELAHSDTSPFSVPDGYPERLRSMTTDPAIIARLRAGESDTASDTDSD